MWRLAAALPFTSRFSFFLRAGRFLAVAFLRRVAVARFFVRRFFAAGRLLRTPAMSAFVAMVISGSCLRLSVAEFPLRKRV